MGAPANRPPLNATFQAVSASIIEGLGQLAGYFGFSKVMGQLFGVLMLSPEPLSLDDLVERLGISKANVSTTMRTMEHMGLVREVWIRDDRRKFYRAESDFWQILTNILRSRELRDVNQALHVLDDSAQRLQEAIPDMEPEDRRLAEYYLDRLSQLQEFFRLAQLLLMSLIERAQDQPDGGQPRRNGLE
ncbi:MAG: MarR family transcriptional regulator [Chloroflexota bacterium]|jgi:DNA-binding transcriptional regulator GbsR (MarR family)